MLNTTVLIRPVELKDARDINALRRMPKVLENLMALPSEPITQNEGFITKQTQNDHLFCAEKIQNSESQIIGMAGLHVRNLARQRHSAIIGMMVHTDFHGKGIGTKLMEAITRSSSFFCLT